MNQTIPEKRPLDLFNIWLYQGLSMKRKWSEKYEVESKEPNFEAKPFIQQYEDAINNWLNTIASYLLKTYDIHYYFHFTELKPDAIVFRHPIGNLNNQLAKHLFALEEIIIRLEEKKSLQIRREISERDYQAGILYKITYSDHTREVKLNDIVLTKTDFNSENDNCFQYIFANPGRPIGIEELQEAISNKVTKRLAHVVRDLGFSGVLQTIFFPVVTKDEVMFMNPISRQYAIEHDLPPINFKKIVRQSKTE